MNLFFRFGSGGSARLVTLELGSRPGITWDRDCSWPGDAGFAVEEQDRRRGMAQGGGCRDHRGLRLRNMAVITLVAQGELRRGRVHRR